MSLPLRSTNFVTYWLSNWHHFRGTALTTEVDCIKSYNLRLVIVKNDGSLWLLKSKPSISVTTSKHYNQVMKQLTEAGIVPASHGTTRMFDSGYGYGDREREYVQLHSKWINYGKLGGNDGSRPC